jgi:hypothetical protein
MIMLPAKQLAITEKLYFFILSFFSLIATTSPESSAQENRQSCTGSIISNWNDCTGTFVKLNEFSYKGEFKNGKRDGMGVLVVLNRKYYGDSYTGSFKENLMHGIGTYKSRNGDIYIGSFRDGKRNGIGTLVYKNGDKYEGGFVDDKRHGSGIFYLASGLRHEGIWKEDQIIERKKISNDQNQNVRRENRKSIPSTPPPTTEADATQPRSYLDESQLAQVFELNVSASEVDDFGNFKLEVISNIEIASLHINGTEYKADLQRRILISMHAPIAGSVKYEVRAKNIYGKKIVKYLDVSREYKNSQIIDQLNPEKINPAIKTESVAVIIGVEKYKRLSSAKYAASDAKYFFDYAQKALGIDSKNIMLLTDSDADSVGVISAISRWLRPRVKVGATEVVFFFSGHGFSNPATKEYYVLTHDSDLDVLGKSSVSLDELMKTLSNAKPKHITMFLDTCFSGVNRSGEPINHQIRPAMPAQPSIEKFKEIPSIFTILSASGANEYSSSSEYLKHGLFSFYLMKGLEGYADSTGDGFITIDELTDYITNSIERHSAISLHKQHPQATGDLGRTIAKINLLAR